MNCVACMHHNGKRARGNRRWRQQKTNAVTKVTNWTIAENEYRKKIHNEKQWKCVIILIFAVWPSSSLSVLLLQFCCHFAFFSLFIYLFVGHRRQTATNIIFVAFGRTTFCIFNFQGPLFWQWSTRSGTFELKTDKNRNCKIEKTTNRLSAHMNRSISLPTTNNKQQQSKRPDDACASTKSKHQPCVLRSFQPIYHISLALPVNDIV